MIRQILQLKVSGASKRSISRQLNISRNTVKRYLALAAGSGLELEELLRLSPEDFFRFLDPERPCDDGPRYGDLQRWFSYVEKELGRPGVTRQHLWLEYKSQHPEGYQYSRFCDLFRRWQARSDVPMVLEHKFGDKLYVDFAGKKLSVRDPQTGKDRAVEVLVTILPASGYTYAEALESQQSAHFIAGVENSLHYMGGVPAAIVPDNLKSAVKKADRYEAALNDRFADFGQHYQTVILPTRSRKPRDKALVENAVSQIYRRVYAPLRNEVFYSLGELNERIRELLKAHNEALYQNRDYSRRDQFDRFEAARLKPLPTERYEILKRRYAKVQKNSHVLLGEDKHYYSVPFRYSGRKVSLLYTHDRVEIWYKQSRIALHRRVKKPFAYSTQSEHMPPSHHFIAQWSPEKFIEWATKIGPQTTLMVKAILERKAHPEQGYKSCLGVISLAKKYSTERLEAACKRALYFESTSYTTVKNILVKSLENMEEEPTETPQIPEHPNIRGGNYYA